MIIEIKGQTPSVNHLYGHNKFGSVYMKTEAKKIRAEIIQNVRLSTSKQGFDLKEWKERLLKVKVVIHEDWYSLKHTVKKKDIANREKFLIDSIMEGLGLDDQYIWEHTMIKQEEPNKEEHKAIINLDFWKYG